MIVETSRGLTIFPAELTDMMILRYPVMVMQPPVALENEIAAQAVIVFIALDIVFLQALLRCEIHITRIADIVTQGVFKVLLERPG